MGLNHKKIENTKYAVKEVLKRIDKRVDVFVDQLVQLRPDEFKGDADAVVDPFALIALLNEDLALQFEDFRKANGWDKQQEKPKEEASVLDFNKKKGDTTH